MSATLLLGIVIGMSSVLFCFGVFLALPARRIKNSNASFNEKSLEQLTIRNGIDRGIAFQLERIADSLVRKESK